MPSGELNVAPVDARSVELALPVVAAEPSEAVLLPVADKLAAEPLLEAERLEVLVVPLDRLPLEVLPRLLEPVAAPLNEVEAPAELLKVTVPVAIRRLSGGAGTVVAAAAPEADPLAVELVRLLLLLRLLLPRLLLAVLVVPTPVGQLAVPVDSTTW